MLRSVDIFIINFFRKIRFGFARIAIFIVFFWFGILKVLGTSPANPLVEELLTKTLPGITFGQFIVFFGILEMVIGIIFLIPRLERLAILLFALHMITTFMPLIVLAPITWQGFLVPTLEGQYIIKNVVLIALAISIAAHLRPMRKS